MKILLVILLTFMTCLSYADVVLHRYYKGNEEQGVCYSGKDGNPAVNYEAQGWSVEVIPESEKQYYIDKQQNEMKAKQNANKALIDKEKQTARTKLKASGLTDKEIDTLLGETKNIIPSEVN